MVEKIPFPSKVAANPSDPQRIVRWTIRRSLCKSARLFHLSHSVERDGFHFRLLMGALRLILEESMSVQVGTGPKLWISCGSEGEMKECWFALAVFESGGEAAAAHPMPRPSPVDSILPYPEPDSLFSCYDHR